jgi:hypothetical protein
MTFRFVAGAAGVDVDPDGEFTVAGVSEGAEGTGFMLLFQCGAADPDDQEVALGLDTHCLSTADQGTAYGCVREAVLTGNVLAVSLDPSALDDLGLDDPEIEVTIEAPADQLAQFREYLPRILGYGRHDALPRRVSIFPSQ